ncbi:low molecular weight phosphotyrosine protein phosphatase [Leeia sp. TBRC 13508]|uniref:protein-tyrosine-phosphatase n=1 Tax=Leeia speluncae TaxID=2884804 RepID=A0ABS8D6G9_9NEIS|nr:low molecular weight protein-tyrosine-phosphatase [Leeia speluncae]MCB6183613.1 low molecular weight phosphotyrosine protein phosphatase [Leeia speluncae]
MVKVLFVCMGNICRSPTAEGVFRAKVKQAGLSDLVLIDSAGTHAYHVGESPDTRSVAAASRRGFDLSDIRARKLTDHDFLEFDYVLAMDQRNLRDIKQIIGLNLGDKAELFLNFSRAYSGQEVPDPYYGGGAGFEDVLNRIEDASEGLLQQIQLQLRKKQD